MLSRLCRRLAFLCVSFLLAGLLGCGGGNSSSTAVVEPGIEEPDTGTPEPDPEPEPEPDKQLIIAIQGESQIAAGSRQTLRGSPDPADGTVSWQWQVLSGSPLEPEIDGSRYTFTAPEVVTPESLNLRLTATDNEGKTGTATKNIAVYPAGSPAQLPAVDAGEDRTLDEATVVEFFGAAQARNGRSIRSLSWTQLSGRPAV